MGRVIGLLAVLVTMAVLFRPLSGAANSGWPVRAPAVVEHGGATTVLALGLDRRGSEFARADAILLVRIGPPGKPTAILSIPRDLWVSIPDRGEDRINAAYTWGEIESGDGASWARRTVEATLGARVDRVVALDFACFQHTIDAAGGVEVQVARRIADDAYPMDDGGTTAVVFEPGWQRMSGQRALQYVRTRSPDSDFGRMSRQQDVVGALTARLRDPAAALGVFQTVLRHCPELRTDLSLIDLAALAAEAAATGELQMRLLEESMVHPATMPSGAQVLLPRWERIRPLVAEMFPRTER